VSEIQFGKRYRRKAVAWNDLEEWMTPTEITDEPMRPLRLRYDSGAFLSASVEWFLGNYELNEAEATPDPVNNPSHYKAGDIECVDLLRALHGEEAFKIHCHLTMVSYLFRLGKKGDPAEDMRKAMRYGQYYLGEDKSNVDN
jgi:hypothetical protein